MHKFKKRTIIILAVFFVFAAVLIIRHYICAACVFTLPVYEQTDIESIVSNKNLSSDDMEQISLQTGVSPDAAMEMIQNGRKDDLIKLNQMLFTKPDITKNYIFYPFTCEERVTSETAPMADLKDGDILLSFNTHTLDWRHGHAAIVVDSQKGIILEHMAIGELSCFGYAKHWSGYPGFIILRYKDQNIAKKAAEYAEKSLVNIKYNIFTGLIKKDKSDETVPSGSHCSHIVWQAYKKFGVDIDFDNGFLVTPRDISKSDKLEVIQVYGLDVEKYKSRMAGYNDK